MFNWGRQTDGKSGVSLCSRTTQHSGLMTRDTRHRLYIHGSYMRRLFRTPCARVKKKRSFLKKLKSHFLPPVDLNNCLKQIKLPISLHACAPISQLPSTGWPISYRKYILQITQPSQCKVTKLQYRFVVISGAPSTLSGRD